MRFEDLDRRLHDLQQQVWTFDPGPDAPRLEQLAYENVCTTIATLRDDAWRDSLTEEPVW